MASSKTESAESDPALTAAFWASVVGRPLEPSVDAELQRLLERGRTAWPGVDVDAATFGTALGGVLRAELPLQEALGEIHAEDLYLAVACGAGSDPAIVALKRTYGAIIRTTLEGRDHHRITAEEIEQAVWIRLFVREGARPAKISSYAGRGKFANWLRIVTARTRADLVRGKVLLQPSGGLGDSWSEIPDTAASPELRHLREQYRVEFKGAFAAAVDKLTGDQRRLLRQQLVLNMRIPDIATELDVHPATVKRRLASARARLEVETQRRLLERLRVGPEHLRSIVGLIRSQLDLSVRRLLKGPTR